MMMSKIWLQVDPRREEQTGVFFGAADVIAVATWDDYVWAILPVI
jgi:hypothetical protein